MSIARNQCPDSSLRARHKINDLRFRVSFFRSRVDFSCISAAVAAIPGPLCSTETGDGTQSSVLPQDLADGLSAP
jgi:hypothetical protein